MSGDGPRMARGAPGTCTLVAALCAVLAASAASRAQAHKIPVGDTVTVMIEYVKAHGRGFFNGVSFLIGRGVDGLTALLRAIPSPLLILGTAALSWVLRRSLPLAVFVIAALLFIMNQGYWQTTLETLSLVISAALISTAIGMPVGIAAAHRPRL